MFFRPTRLIINLSALENNYRQIRKLVGDQRRICAVVKANGYGMGSVALAHHLEELGCDYFGVATLMEAEELRSAGIKKPIILLGALCGKDSLWEALLLDLEISIHHMAVMDDLADLKPDERAKLRFHLKVDTGMSRLGLQPSEIQAWCQRAKSLGIQLNGLFTTLTSSDQKDNSRTAVQIELFNKMKSTLKENGFNPTLCHIANSGAILNFPETLSDMVRPGLLLHGVSSFPSNNLKGFRPITRLESEIVQLTSYESGTPFGYSSAFRVDRATRAAIIPVGYADGLNRLLSNKGEVLIKGKRAVIMGKVSMDLAMVDVTDIEGVALGDKVTVLGVDGEDEITPWEMAQRLNSIPWELFCWVGPRVPRVYVSDEK